jgi:hypothetical protein
MKERKIMVAVSLLETHHNEIAGKATRDNISYSMAIGLILAEYFKTDPQNVIDSSRKRIGRVPPSQAKILIEASKRLIPLNFEELDNNRYLPNNLYGILVMEGMSWANGVKVTDEERKKIEAWRPLYATPST